MSRIVIDDDLCQGTKECAALVPGLVSFDSVGVAVVDPTAPAISSDDADRLVATCPSMAISVIEP